MPELPSLSGKFIDDGRLDRSKESFQGMIFKGLRQNKEEAISFHRSDFRGANISDCYFHGNNFSRADFISARILDTKFISCDFLTSHISNSILKNCRFENNINFNPDIYRCDLFDCDFVNQSTERTTWRDSRFTRCNFIGFAIERSNVENTSFVDCDLSRIDLSQMSAIDIVFNNCRIDDAIIDPDYLGSYVFISTKLDKIKFAYRSENLDFNLSDPCGFISLGKYLESQGRWSEAFNLKIIGMQIHSYIFKPKTIREDWMLYLANSVRLAIPSDAAENIARMFNIVKLYLESGVINISDVLMFIAFADELSRATLNALVYEALITGRANLLGTIQNLQNIEKLLAVDPRSKENFRFQVQIESDDESMVEHNFIIVMNKITEKIGMAYQIIRIGYGSILVEAISTLAVILVFFRVARYASYNLAEIRVAHQLGKKFSEIARNAKSMETVLETVKAFRESLPQDPPVSELVTDEVVEVGKSISAIAREIKSASTHMLSLVKEIRIFIDDFRNKSQS